jgi:hypothetical protein
LETVNGYESLAGAVLSQTAGRHFSRLGQINKI